MQGGKESWAYQLFQTAALKLNLKKKKKSDTYFIINNDKVQQLDFPMNEHLHLEKKREKVTKREDVTKEGDIPWQ